jgi:hypothetical protein
MHGWSVREIERRARPPAPRPAAPRRATATHPDLEASLARVADALGSTLGADVRVTPRGDGCRVQLEFASVEEALALVERLGAAVSV